MKLSSLAVVAVALLVGCDSVTNAADTTTTNQRKNRVRGLKLPSSPIVVDEEFITVSHIPLFFCDVKRRRKYLKES